MCRRSQPLITLLWITLMLSGCPSRSDHTHGHGHTHREAHTHAGTEGHTGTQAAAHGQKKTAHSTTGGVVPVVQSAADSLVITDGVLLPDGDAMLLVLRNAPDAQSGKTVVLFLGRADDDRALTGSWTVAAPGRVDRRETQVYGTTDLSVILRDREGKPMIRVTSEELTPGPGGAGTTMHRQADEGIRFYRQIRRITASSLHLALNRLSRVAGSADWHPTVRQQAFVSVGMRTPAEDAIDVSGTWRSLSLSGTGEMRAWTFSEGRYHSSSVQGDPGTTDEALVGSYTSGERGWGLLTPDGDSTARLHVLLDIAGGFGLAFHAVVNRDGVLQEGEGIYDGTSFWWRPDATKEERDISGSWRVFGRLLTPPEDDGTVKDAAILEAYAGSIEIDEKGALSGRLGYWGTPPWITLSGKVSYRGGPSGALEAEIPLDLRGHTTPPTETPRVPRPSKHGHPHPPGGAVHQ